MKDRAIRLGIGFLAAAVLLGAAPGEDLAGKARAMIDALRRGDYEAATRDFDATMRGLSGPEKTGEFWTILQTRIGAFKERTAERRENLGQFEIVLVTCVFEKTTLDARIVFDAEGKIAGFQFVPSSPPVESLPPPYADRERFTETEVTVGSEPWTLPGTLARPKENGPVPAVVLVHGSGPNDRDETIGPNKPFRDLAWGLASRGIAVLRYEKRTRVYGTKLAADASLTVREEVIDDAVEAVRLLQKTAGLDPRRIFVLGHSLGGMLMPRLALALKPLGAAGFISLAGLTYPLEDTILVQTAYILSLDGGLSGEDRKKLEEVETDVAKIKALTEADRGSTEKPLNAAPAYWLDLRGYDPLETVVRVDRPMLFLQGGRDYQVVPENLERWKKALEGRSDAAFKLFPKLNHLFGEGEGISTPSEYLEHPKVVAKDVIDEIEAFVLKGGNS
ncbi:MAG: Alpha/beta hydrolase family protein [Candidatus Aminicenantes bacterium ADurb.Bin147]|nr:MAG: Alpha/beta hydrolase family protein [Candidatus Aminicenantes bacterium ADurb.Bin147]